MQTLYNLSTLESDIKPGEPQKILQNHFDQTRQLLVHLTYFLTEVCRYAETDFHQRAGKHLPSFEDLHVNTKLSGNKILWRILEDTSFKEALAKTKPQLLINKDLVRRAYLRLAETPEYKSYINKQNKIMEDITHYWTLKKEQSEAEIINQNNFYNQLNKEGKELSDNLAINLLKTAHEKSEHLQTLIVPKLKNWDPERIALLDMILMKMGVAEFLYFETIPPKVTINEYIDLAKEYSTPQSGQFVNGILDNIHKELVAEGKMQKVDYKKV